MNTKTFMSHTLFLGCVLFIGELNHLALDKTDIDTLVDSRLKQARDWQLAKMTASVTTDEHLKNIVTALKAATLESPIITVVYVSGMNTSIDLLGKIIKNVRECVVPKPTEMMTTPCYIGKTWSELSEQDVSSYVEMLGEILKLTTKNQVNHCILHEPYLDQRYATADSKFHVRTMMDKLMKVVPLPKKVKKIDTTGGILNIGTNRTQNSIRAQEPEMTTDGFLVKDLNC